MCPSESEVFDSVLDNAAEPDEAEHRSCARLLLSALLFLPRLIIVFIISPFSWFWRSLR
jgi:hypothetical protein